jgi:Protein of unknown function (DUF3376)/Domain of unknown function (DUF1905)
LDDIAGMRHCPAYARYRAAADLPRLGDLFVQPQQTVGRQAVFRFLNPARAVRAEELLLFRDPLTLAYQDRPLCERLGSDLTAVAATAGFLIAWVRSYEQWRRNAPGDCADTFPADRPLGEIKRVLYRLLTTAIILRDLSEHGLLAGGRPEATADWLGKAIEGVLDHQEALRLPDGLWQYLDVRDTPTRSPEAEEAEFYDSLAAAINTMDTGTPAVDRLWELLATALRLLTTDIAPASCSHGQCREWRESPYHLFLEFPEVLGAPDGVRRLEPLFAGAGGLPDSAGMVTFHVLDADERAHVDTMLPGLRAAKIKALAADICAGRHVDLSDDWLTYDVKLAGHQLGAFGGFLSARWRANDWMWGRADAAAVIVRLLLQRAVATKKMPAESVATTAATYGARLQESIINVDVEAAVHDPHEPAGTVEPPPPRRSSTALADLDTGMQSMSALAPSHRSRLAMCTGLIAYRAVWPVRWTATAILGRAALIAVRPLLLAALLFGMASRGTLVLALALGAGAAAHAGVNGHAPSRAVGIVVVLAAVLATLWARAIVAARHVRDTNPSTDIGRLAKQMAGRMLALRWATTLVTTIALAGAASVVTVRDGWPRIYHAIGTGPTESYLALLLLVAALGIGLARVGTGVVGRIHWAAVLVWCAALAVLVGVAVLSAWRHLLPADVPAGTAVAVGAGLVVVLTIVCVADWIRPAWLVLALFLATAGYAAWLWVATNWFPAVTVTHTLGGGLVTGLVAFRQPRSISRPGAALARLIPRARHPRPELLGVAYCPDALDPVRLCDAQLVIVSFDAELWTTSIFPDSARGSYVLPIKRSVRKAEALEVGDVASVTVRLIDV